MGRILHALDMNEEVTLTYRGREKATIVPSGKKKKASAKTHPAFGMWADREDMADVEKTVRTLRKDRFNAF
jgi:antitoxin (DNA-binding transcriptional repressor) of toxin-antitoxin stability system